MKLAMQRVVIKVTMVDQKKSRTRAMKIAATAFESVALSGAEKDEIVVTGKGIDTVELARLLRKKLGSADLLSVGTVPEEKKKAEKENADYVVPLVQGSQPYYHYNSYPVACAHDHDPPACSIM